MYGGAGGFFAAAGGEKIPKPGAARKSRRISGAVPSSSGDFIVNEVALELALRVDTIRRIMVK